VNPQKKSRDRKENGKCTNATNCRSHAGLSTSPRHGTPPKLGPLHAEGAGIKAFRILGVSF